MKIPSNKKAFFSWLWVGLCSLSIFLIVPAALAIQRFVSDHLGKKFFVYFVLAILATAFVCLFYFLIFRLKIRSLSNYIWLFIVAGLYLYFTLKLWNSPPVAIHFLEYGLLGFFLFRALIHHVRDKSIYFTVTLFALFIGTFDEIFQWIIPQRFWDFCDVGLNALSAGLYQLAMWKVIRPKIISEKVKHNSIKIFTSIFAVCIMLLGLCASNTPKRVAYYTKLFPRLSFLQKEEPMSEFGDKYMDLEVGIFHSRLNLMNLQNTDEIKGKYYAQILNESANKDYKKFLRECNPFTEPFLYELRVHIFRRDTYFDRANKTSNLDEKKEFYFIAYKENLIIVKYFSQSIKDSVYVWDENKIKEAGALIDKSKPYKSPVSANLFTSFSEKTMWISIFSLIFILVVINLIFPIIKNSEKKVNKKIKD